MLDFAKYAAAQDAMRLLPGDLPPLTDAPAHSVLATVRAMVAMDYGPVTAYDGDQPFYDGYSILPNQAIDHVLDLMVAAQHRECMATEVQIAIERHFRGRFVPTPDAVRMALWELYWTQKDSLCDNCGQDPQLQFECPRAQCRAQTERHMAKRAGGAC